VDISSETSAARTLETPKLLGLTAGEPSAVFVTSALNTKYAGRQPNNPCHHQGSGWVDKNALSRFLLVTRHIRFGRIRRRRHTDGWGAAVGRLGLRSDVSGITLLDPIAAQCLLAGSGIAGGPPEDGTASFCAQSRTAAVPPSCTAFKPHVASLPDGLEFGPTPTLGLPAGRGSSYITNTRYRPLPLRPLR
jgi:hypothetical protein